MTTAVGRLRSWAIDSRGTVNFYRRADGVWFVTAAREGVFNFQFESAAADDPEKAAQEIVDRLIQVGEELPA